MKIYTVEMQTLRPRSYLFDPTDFPLTWKYVSAYKHVIIGWDKGMDEDVLEFLGGIEDRGYLPDLIAIQEHNADIALFWHLTPVPDKYDVDIEILMNSGNTFRVTHSFMV